LLPTRYTTKSPVSYSSSLFEFFAVPVGWAAGVLYQSAGCLTLCVLPHFRDSRAGVI
jgi:hypothetical protein